MKRLIKPLIVTTLLIASSNSYALGYSAEKLEDMIERMDGDNDDKIKFKEYFKNTFTKNSDSYDVNQDGYITSGEIVLEIKEDLLQTIAEMHKQGVSEEDINKTMESELDSAKKEAEAMIDKMDTDGDNLVEPDEIKAFKQKQFDALDRNHDGALSELDTGKVDYIPAKGYNIVPYDPS